MAGSSAPLILASASPRRVDLLAQVGITPDNIIPADIDETPLKGEHPRTLAQRLAIGKAEKIFETEKTSFILAADCVVAVGRRDLGKPEDEADARRMLTLLSGRRHKVYGGICVIAPSGKKLSRLVETTVSFRRLAERDIAAYVDGRDWEGKAGGYAIQGMAATFVKFLSGSYSNVIGLSVYDTVRMLESSGYKKD